jgi:hypothetical protein
LPEDFERKTMTAEFVLYVNGAKVAVADSPGELDLEINKYANVTCPPGGNALPRKAEIWFETMKARPLLVLRKEWFYPQDPVNQPAVEA